MKKIAASILGKENKKELINSLIDKGIDIIHYDVMDGKFVNNNSLPLEEIFYLLKNTKNHYKDIHLMVDNPSKWVDKLIGKADQISVHFESEYDTDCFDFIKKHKNSKKIGLAINPETSINDIAKFIPYLNHLMIMSVIPGKGGQSFIENSLIKIDELILLKNSLNKDLIIQIDGGINDTWGPIVFDKGVNIGVSGSYLINNINNNSISNILGK